MEQLKLLNNLLYKKFIIFTKPRTGSSLLVSYLNSHPNIESDGEVLRQLYGKNYQDILANVFSKQPDMIKAKGFKYMYFHPIDGSFYDVWKDINKMNNMWIIHLKRRNILRTIISHKIARIQNKWFIDTRAEQNENIGKSITFTVDELKQEFKNTKKWEFLGDIQFKNHPMLTVFYEDLVNNTEIVFNSITNFLDVKYKKPKTYLKKQNPEDMRILINNYDELKKAFAKTQWQSYFIE